MKKTISKKVTLILSAFVLSLGLVNCSSNDDGSNYEQPGPGSIDVAIGTYKGKISSYRSLPNTYETTFYNAEIIVSKVDDQHVKITTKSGEIYSILTEKTMKVSNDYDNIVESVLGEINGHFTYVHDTKTLRITTYNTSETDYQYSFEGVKQ